MSIQQFFDLLSQHSLWVVAYFLVLFGMAGLFSHRHAQSPSRFNARVLSMVVFLVAIPGIMAALVLFYSLFFTQQNLLDVNVVLYFLPIVAMVVTLFLISKQVSLNQLPGFDRLSGLIGILALTGLAILLLYKLRFFVGFFASIQSLLLFGVVFYFLFKWAWKKLTVSR